MGTDMERRTPHGRKTSAMRATSWIISGVSSFGFGVDVVDGAAVDSDRSQQARVLAGAGEVAAHLIVVEEDGAAAVAALDGAVEVVPLIDPADGRGREFRCPGVAQSSAPRAMPERTWKVAVEQAAGIGAGDDPVLVAVSRDDGDGKAFRAGCGRAVFGKQRRGFLQRCPEPRRRRLPESLRGWEFQREAPGRASIAHPGAAPSGH